jgi:hypothetical protein
LIEWGLQEIVTTDNFADISADDLNRAAKDGDWIAKEVFLEVPLDCESPKYAL